MKQLWMWRVWSGPVDRHVNIIDGRELFKPPPGPPDNTGWTGLQSPVLGQKYYLCPAPVNGCY